MSESGYLKKKAYFDELLTLFGRKPVMEALESEEIEPVRLHLATSNRDSPLLQEMLRAAGRRGVPVFEHTRRELSRISRNGRQDQGVAIDIKAPRYRPVQELRDLAVPDAQLIAVDQVTNPQNLGMIVRAVGASPAHGVIIPLKGSARIDGLVIKASAGTLFKTRIYHCADLASALVEMRAAGYRIFGLDSKGDLSIETIPTVQKNIFVLGNETSGLSSNIRKHCDDLVRIPLANDIESLNVSVTAGIVAFRSIFRDIH